MLMGKRGISPIIATVLLIAFAVVLAALVMNWQTKFVEKLQKTADKGVGGEIDCLSDVDINIKLSDGGLIVENNKDTTIAGIIVREYKTDGNINVKTKNDVSDLGIEIGSYASKTYSTLTYSSAGEISKVQVIPIIKSEDGEPKNCDAQSETVIVPT